MLRKGVAGNLKEEALDRALWRTGFGRGCGPLLRQTGRCNSDTGWQGEGWSRVTLMTAKVLSGFVKCR